MLTNLQFTEELLDATIFNMRYAKSAGMLDDLYSHADKLLLSYRNMLSKKLGGENK